MRFLRLKLIEWNLIPISFGLFLGTPAIASPAPIISANSLANGSATLQLQMAGGNGCPAAHQVSIRHLNQDELELSIPSVKISAESPMEQSKACRLSLSLKNGENRQFAVVGASFQLDANIEAGNNARVTLETYAQGIDPETKTNLVLTGPRQTSELVNTRHEPKWSLCSGGRLFNAGLSLRMGKVGGGPAAGASFVKVTGPVKLKLLWRDCAVSAAR